MGNVNPLTYQRARHYPVHVFAILYSIAVNGAGPTVQSQLYSATLACDEGALLFQKEGFDPAEAHVLLIGIGF